MKFKFPLYAQIICVFVLNIAVLAFVQCTIFNNQFNLGWESLMFRTVGERVQTVAFLMFRQFETLPQDKWNDVLKEYGDFYNVKFFVFDNQGNQVAGEKADIPASVISKITVPPHIAPPKPDADFLFSAPAGQVGTFKVVEESRFLAPLDRLINDRPGPMPPRFFLHTRDPDCYWIGAMFPVRLPGSRAGFFRFNTFDQPVPHPTVMHGEAVPEAGLQPPNPGAPPPNDGSPPPHFGEPHAGGPPGFPPPNFGGPPHAFGESPPDAGSLQPGFGAPPLNFQPGVPSDFPPHHFGTPPEFPPQDGQGQPHHQFTVMSGPGGHVPGTLLAVTPNIWQTRLVSDFGNLFLIALGVIALSLIVWWPFVFIITYKLGKLTKATEKIADGDFDIRLNLRRWDEIGRLGQAVNLMAGRLKSFVTGQKRFLGDISHELCSPIARLQVAIEILERTATEQQQSSIRDIREEVDQMNALINELLAFSKAGVRETELRAVCLVPILASAASKTGGDKIQITAPATLACLGDEVLLERAFGNILRNAVRYAGDAGPITVNGERHGNDTTITIIDQGPGVPPEAIELLGQPFYRPESARTRTTGGVGLGLSIVKTCIEACHGTFSVQNNSPTGLRIDIRLKAANADESSKETSEPS